MISVIVPVYNTEKQLERCISSICHQTYRDLEIIIIDDGSTDGSGALCDILAQHESRIRIIHQDNQGLSAARNSGMRIANGEYIAFVDSDDWISPIMMGILYETAVKHNADIVECGFSELFNDHTQHFCGFSGQVSESDSCEAIIGLTLWQKFYSVVWNKLYRKNVCEGVSFPRGRTHEDEFTTWKFLRNANKIISVDASLYYYDRTRTDSITATLSDNTLDKVDAFEELCLYAWGTSNPALILAANNEYSRSSLDTIACLWRNDLKTERLLAYISRIRKLYRHIRNCNYPLMQTYDKCLSLLSDDDSYDAIETAVCEWERVGSTIHHG